MFTGEVCHCGAHRVHDRQRPVLFPHRRRLLGHAQSQAAPLQRTQALGKALCPARVGAGEIITAQPRVVRTDGCAAVTAQALPPDTSPMTGPARNGRRRVVVEAASAEEAPLRGASTHRSRKSQTRSRRRLAPLPLRRLKTLSQSLLHLSSPKAHAQSARRPRHFPLQGTANPIAVPRGVCRSCGRFRRFNHA